MAAAWNVGIFVFDDVEVLDFAGPYEVFNVASEVAPRDPNPPLNVYSIGHTGEVVSARGMLKIQPSYSIYDAPQADILVIPGGFGTRRLLKNDVVLNWLREQSGRVQHLLSVCTGSLLLAKAGLLDDLSATTHHGSFEQLRALAPNATVLTDKRYVVNEKIITSGGISAGIDMSLYFVERLLGSEVVAAVREEMEWQWHQAEGAQPNG